MKHIFVIGSLLLVLPVVAMAVAHNCELDGVKANSHTLCIDKAEQTVSVSKTLLKVDDALVKRELLLAITKLKGDKARLQSRRDIEITKLRRSTLKGNNNLAGAAWEERLFKEMAAITAKYETNIRAVDSKIDRLSKQLRHL
jgi:hypothetical protein